MILAMLKSWWESSFAEVARKSWGKPQGGWISKVDGHPGFSLTIYIAGGICGLFSLGGGNCEKWCSPIKSTEW